MTNADNMYGSAEHKTSLHGQSGHGQSGHGQNAHSAQNVHQTSDAYGRASSSEARSKTSAKSVSGMGSQSRSSSAYTQHQNARQQDSRAQDIRSQETRSYERRTQREEHHGAVSRQSHHLARTIETEIIPRLLLTQIAIPKLSAKNVLHTKPISDEEINLAAFGQLELDAFCTLVVQKSLRQAIAFIDDLLAKGMSIETMITDVLSVTARHLGAMWEEDTISFVDVSLGLSRLQQLLRVYGPAFEADFIPKQEGHRILLAAMPGEQHTFGMSVVEEFFRRDGWDVESETTISGENLLMRAKQEWFDVIGLSASAEASICQIKPLILSLRENALNQNIRIIVGGCTFLAQPENALALGADLVACNGQEAVLNVERLLDPQKT